MTLCFVHEKLLYRIDCVEVDWELRGSGHGDSFEFNLTREFEYYKHLKSRWPAALANRVEQIDEAEYELLRSRGFPDRAERILKESQEW